MRRVKSRASDTATDEASELKQERSGTTKLLKIPQKGIPKLVSWSGEGISDTKGAQHCGTGKSVWQAHSWQGIISGISTYSLLLYLKGI